MIPAAGGDGEYYAAVADLLWRYVDEGEYHDPQEIIDLLRSAIHAYVLACDAGATLF
jgi:hypothetical protein